MLTLSICKLLNGLVSRSSHDVIRKPVSTPILCNLEGRGGELLEGNWPLMDVIEILNSPFPVTEFSSFFVSRFCFFLTPKIRSPTHNNTFVFSQRTTVIDTHTFRHTHSALFPITKRVERGTVDYRLLVNQKTVLLLIIDTNQLSLD